MTTIRVGSGYVNTQPTRKRHRIVVELSSATHGHEVVNAIKGAIHFYAEKMDEGDEWSDIVVSADGEPAQPEMKTFIVPIYGDGDDNYDAARINLKFHSQDGEDVISYELGAVDHRHAAQKLQDMGFTEDVEYYEIDKDGNVV